MPTPQELVEDLHKETGFLLKIWGLGGRNRRRNPVSHSPALYRSRPETGFLLKIWGLVTRNRL
ncbi:MAG TPA: hypothetical protein DCY88_20560 [Cyanobacteria bacterium UBA11372]|nr:hypothetical protein [Cyanobacteria bacterium UBA11372]